MTEFRQVIESMQNDGSLSEDAATRVLLLYRICVSEMAADLRTKVREWELMDPDDQKLYSLGLRHAIDFLEEEVS